MYGETHVDPTALFDPGRGQQPPPDGFDLYFHAPLSLSLVGDAFAVNGMTGHLEQLRKVYASLAAQTVVMIQRRGGYVTGGHRGRAVPARLEITSVVEDSVPGQPGMRLHTHVYVGRTAIALDTGQRHPVDQQRLTKAADDAWRSYLTRLIATTSEALEFVWAALPDHSSGDEEIVDPPMAEHVIGQEFGICPGPGRVAERIMADARWRADVGEIARTMAAERARGISY